jgi:hypothetical protein
VGQALLGWLLDFFITLLDYPKSLANVSFWSVQAVESIALGTPDGPVPKRTRLGKRGIQPKVESRAFFWRPGLREPFFSGHGGKSCTAGR